MSIDAKPYYDAWQAAEKDAAALSDALAWLNELAVAMAWRFHPRESELQPARIAAQDALRAHIDRIEAMEK